MLGSVRSQISDGQSFMRRDLGSVILGGLLACVAGGALEAAAFGWVLSRQLRHGDRGRALGAYLLFTALALAVLIVDALRL